MSRVARNPQDIHDVWMSLWRMHACAEEPSWQVMRDLHKALSEQEAALYARSPRQCIEALRERLETARRAGLELTMPEWASRAAKELAQVLAEEV